MLEVAQAYEWRVANYRRYGPRRERKEVVNMGIERQLETPVYSTVSIVIEFSPDELWLCIAYCSL